MPYPLLTGCTYGSFDRETTGASSSSQKGVKEAKTGERERFERFTPCIAPGLRGL